MASNCQDFALGPSFLRVNQDYECLSDFFLVRTFHVYRYKKYQLCAQSRNQGQNLDVSRYPKSTCSAAEIVFCFVFVFYVGESFDNASLVPSKQKGHLLFSFI